MGIGTRMVNFVRFHGTVGMRGRLAERTQSQRYLERLAATETNPGVRALALRRLCAGVADSQVAMRRGLDAANSKGYAEALIWFDRAIELAPRSADAHLNKCRALNDLGRKEEALASLERTMGSIGVFPDALVLKGAILASSPDGLDKAILCFDRALAVDPRCFGAMKNKGLALLEQGKFREAEQCFRTMLAIEPNRAEAYFDLGNCLRAQAKPKEAIAAYDKAIQINPEYADAMNNRGLILMAQNNLTEAAGMFRKVLMLDQANANALANMGALLLKQQKVEEAMGYFEQALQANPRLVPALINMGGCLLLSRNFSAALISFDRALELEPNNAEAYLKKGIVLANMVVAYEAVGERERAFYSARDAAKNLNRAIELCPSYGSHPDIIQCFGALSKHGFGKVAGEAAGRGTAAATSRRDEEAALRDLEVRLSALGSPIPQQRAMAARTLGQKAKDKNVPVEIKTRMIKPLIDRAINDPNPDVQSSARYTLALLLQSNISLDVKTEVIDPLIEGLANMTQDEYIVAIVALARYVKSSIPATLRTKIAPPLIKALTEISYPATQKEIVAALEDINESNIPSSLGREIKKVLLEVKKT